MTRQLSDKDRKNREDFWQAIRGFKFTHHVTLIFRLTMLIIYVFSGGYLIYFWSIDRYMEYGFGWCYRL